MTPLELPHRCTCPHSGADHCPIFDMPLPAEARAVCRGEQGAAEQLLHQQTWAEFRGVPLAADPEPTEPAHALALTNPHRTGPGDWLHWLFSHLGIARLVKWWTRGNCRCASRRAKLNAWWFRLLAKCRRAKLNAWWCRLLAKFGLCIPPGSVARSRVEDACGDIE